MENSVCLISNRSDVVDFIKKAIGCFNRIQIMTEITDLACRLSRIILLDAASFYEVCEQDYLERNKLQTIICLLPSDCSGSKKMAILQKFQIVIPIPCEVSLIQKLVHDLLLCIKPSIHYPFNPNPLHTNPIFENLYGKSLEMTKLKQQIEEVAEKEKPVLIIGETGTGKTTIASYIHKLSRRHKAEFSTISIPNISDELCCSSLFGTSKGAFTDAVDSNGLFRKANGGTVFLDEIGFASHRLQGNLLTFIENGKIRSVGKDSEDKVDVRLLFATNANLSAMRMEGSFREDFYHRISTYKIHLPALREHISDLQEIIAPMLQEAKKELDHYAYEKMMNYTWPGNIRELLNCVEKACTYCKKSVITDDYVDFDL